ncbi:phosphoribosylglycinamide formyltransferase [Falsiroseomonas sp. HC035]|uniref:phosphoribosylglycinamide formyltransferase n=1 Tax=Falsiroseomonas sp. HC035 TaxID=3390999 RepID=UPI003D31D6F6
MAALLRAAAVPDYPAEIGLVLSNRADAPGLALAQAAGVPTVVVESRGRDKAGFEAAMQAEFTRHGIGLLALAGFMRVLTPNFCRAWQDRLVNIHPSLLPSFRGLDTHARALAAGVRLHGCTVHLVTPGVDEGPILAQAAVAVLPRDTEATLAARVLAQEHLLYPAALAWLAAGRVRIVDDVAEIDAPGAEGAFANPLPLAAALPTNASTRGSV